MNKKIFIDANILSRKNHCETIISNDKNFVAKDIWLTSSQVFCKDHGL